MIGILHRDDDLFAAEIAGLVAKELAKRSLDRPLYLIGLGHALLALNRFPEATPGINCEFGVHYEFNKEQQWITFRLTDEEFAIEQGATADTWGAGTDYFPGKGWYVGPHEEVARDCDCADIPGLVDELLTLGAKIAVFDESNISFEQLFD